MLSFKIFHRTILASSVLMFSVSCSGGGEGSTGKVSSKGILKTLPSITTKAVNMMDKINEEEKSLETELMTAMQSGNAGKAQKVQEKAELIMSRKKTLIDETLKSMDGVISEAKSGFSLPFLQSGSDDTYTIKSIIVKNAVWNPGTTPHLACNVNIEAKVKIKERLKFSCEFTGKDGNIIHTEKAYWGVGGKKPDTGGSATLHLNPKVDKIIGMHNIIIKKL